MKFARTPKDFNWRIMYDEEIGYDQNVFNKIEELFLIYNKERRELLDFEKKCHNWTIFHKEIEHKISKSDAKLYQTDWQALYNVYRNKCLLVCPDVRELANILLVLTYEKYPNKHKRFMWHMAGAGLVANIKPVPVQLPYHDENGDHIYLGKKYSLGEPQAYEAISVRGD